eukprot:GHVR01051417.1.p1 GENE.GHVR01051417.1~~GHVR01051417.1.p1  ORF type:complete len:168 (-),score=4.52 GHVR01051417.1:25-528(-)
MMLPFLAHVFKGKGVSLVPIVVGSLSPQAEEFFGKILYKYFADPRTLFVLSSDFCHWGSRFRYTYVKTENRDSSYNDAIKALDQDGIDLIESHKPKEFSSYLRLHGNTICGRHPIGILLWMAAAAPEGSLRTQLMKYGQSEKVRSTKDSCVGYASIVTSLTGKTLLG